VQIDALIPKGVSFVGVDFSEAMLLRAKKKLAKEGVARPCELICADLNKGGKCGKRLGGHHEPGSSIRPTALSDTIGPTIASGINRVVVSFLLRRCSVRTRRSTDYFV
jgi:hypothetical protein